MNIMLYLTKILDICIKKKKLQKLKMYLLFSIYLYWKSKRQIQPFLTDKAKTNGKMSKMPPSDPQRVALIPSLQRLYISTSLGAR